MSQQRRSFIERLHDNAGYLFISGQLSTEHAPVKTGEKRRLFLMPVLWRQDVIIP